MSISQQRYLEIYELLDDASIYYHIYKELLWLSHMCLHETYYIKSVCIGI